MRSPAVVRDFQDRDVFTFVCLVVCLIDRWYVRRYVENVDIYQQHNVKRNDLLEYFINDR